MFFPLKKSDSEVEGEMHPEDCAFCGESVLGDEYGRSRIGGQPYHQDCVPAGLEDHPSPILAIDEYQAKFNPDQFSESDLPSGVSEYVV
jgi:hypothetical protein